MAISIVINSAGLLAPAVGASGGLSGTAGESLALGDVVCVKTADGKLWKCTGTEALTAAIVGICDGTYATDTTARYWGVGEVASGLTGLTAGAEYWAKETAALSAYSSVTSTNWTRPMGVAKTTTSLEIRIGDVVQKP